MSRLKLGVNIDHVATLRQARGGIEPRPLEAARVALEAGADSIVVHLREDRRHINEEDVRKLRKAASYLNLEMSIVPEIVDIAVDIKPDQATLVPEKREELTTEGGLDVAAGKKEIGKAIKNLQKAGIKVSLFIDPDDIQVKAASEVGANLIELHTGSFANAADEKARNQQLEKLSSATELAIKAGLIVAAGHGLNYQNVKEVAGIKGIEELNIGHSIISRAVFAGLDKAVREMIGLIRDA